ncbi:MAG: hypothetical protein DDT25_00125 [Chloroflexi bacterium]|nr:hypothetical protein [Chloroflexota bacterium]
MAMQTDVLSTQPLNATGNFQTQGGTNLGRSRIKAIYAVCGASAGNVTIRDGASGGVLVQIATPTSVNAGSIYIIMPGQGILADRPLHGTLTNATSVVVFYG